MQAGASQLTRQVVSRAGTGGCNLRDGQLLAALSARYCIRTGAFCPDIGTVPCLRKEFRIHEGPEHRITDIALQAPETSGLRRCQSKSRHFHILTLDPLKHVVHTHGPPRETTSFSLFDRAVTDLEQLVYRTANGGKARPCLNTRQRASC
jgi:hypothetical protein